MDLDSFLNFGSIMTLNNGEILLGWNQKYYGKNNSEYSFYFPTFFLDSNKNWFSHKNQGVFTKSELIQLLSKLTLLSPKKMNWNQPDKKKFSFFYNTLKNNYLDTGILKKGVPFTIQKSLQKLSKEQFICSLKNLIIESQNKPIYLYGTWNEKEGILGGTPEILFTRSSSNLCTIETVACAGTIRTHLNQKLLSDSKELDEHEYVIKGIEESLKEFGKIDIQKTNVYQYSEVSHLLTKISLITKSIIPFEKLVSQLHPTPALGTYPKESGKIWLNEMQKVINRKHFGAPVGYYNSQNHDSACYVAIRNMQWNKIHVVITAGCGVVEQSIKENEWKEVLLKLNAIKKMLAL